VAQHHVLDLQLGFLELVKDGVIGVGAVLFVVDPRLERGMLVAEGFDMGFVHWGWSFPLVDGVGNKSRFGRRVSRDRLHPPLLAPGASVT